MIIIEKRTKAMNNLVIGIFKDEVQAEEARRHLLEKSEQSLEVEDAVIVKKTGEGEIQFRHLGRETLVGALTGSFWGSMFGILLLNPIFALAGLVIGFIVGGIFGAFSHIGVDPDFVRSEAISMNPGNSAVCILTRENAGKILKEIMRFKQDLLQTKLCTQKVDLKQCSIVPEEAGTSNSVGAILKRE